MRTVLIFFAILITINLFSDIEVKNSFFGFKYNDSKFLKNGYYADSQIVFKKVNDKFHITFSYNKIIPKRVVDIPYQIDVHTVKIDSVYYHNVWVDDTFYQTFVYDTTFVDTNFTITDTARTRQEDINQMEISFDWTHRLFLWYDYGLLTKYAYMKDNQFLLSGAFSQTFHKKIGYFNLSYTNFFIGTYFKTTKTDYRRETIFEEEIFNTTEDSLYQFQPDSVLTYVRTSKSFDIPIEVTEKIKNFQFTQILSVNYKKFSATLAHSLLKNSRNNYYKSDLLYTNYLFSANIGCFWGNPYLMHDFDYGYFNSYKEELNYGLYGILRIFSLDKKRNVKIGVSYSKFKNMQIKGILFGFGLKF